jgi:uncharacterized membrane protein
MTLFLWVLIVGFAASAISKLIMLATGKFAPRRPTFEAVDVAINVCLLVWAARLL